MNKTVYARVLEIQEIQVEKKTDDLMEHICDKCHFTFTAKNQDKLDEICEMCPMFEQLTELLNLQDVAGQIRALKSVSAGCEALVDQAVDG